MSDMPTHRGYFEFVSHGGAAYAIAGWSGTGEIRRVDRWSQAHGWVQVLNTVLLPEV